MIMPPKDAIGTELRMYTRVQFDNEHRYFNTQELLDFIKNQPRDKDQHTIDRIPFNFLNDKQIPYSEILERAKQFPEPKHSRSLTIGNLYPDDPEGRRPKGNYHPIVERICETMATKTKSFDDKHLFMSFYPEDPRTRLAKLTVKSPAEPIAILQEGHRPVYYRKADLVEKLEAFGWTLGWAQTNPLKHPCLLPTKNPSSKTKKAMEGAIKVLETIATARHTIPDIKDRDPVEIFQEILKTLKPITVNSKKDEQKTIPFSQYLAASKKLQKTKPEYLQIHETRIDGNIQYGNVQITGNLLDESLKENSNSEKENPAMTTMNMENNRKTPDFLKAGPKGDAAREKMDYSLPNSLTDLAGVPLRPYCRFCFGGKDLIADNYYVATEDVLKCIKENDPWNGQLQTSLILKQVPFEKVLEESEKSIRENGTLKSHFTVDQRNRDQDYYSRVEQVCETVYFEHKNKNPEIAMSFIPSNLNTECVLEIHSKLSPLPVYEGNIGKLDQIDKDQIPKAYPRSDLLNVLQKQKWRQMTPNNKFYFAPIQMPKGSTPAQEFENILHGIDPITVKPDGSRKSIHLEAYLQQGKIRAVSSEVLYLGKKQVTGHISPDSIPHLRHHEERLTQNKNVNQDIER